MTTKWCGWTIAMVLAGCGETKQIGELDEGSSDGDDSGSASQTASDSMSSTSMTTTATTDTETASGTATMATTDSDSATSEESSSEGESSGTDTDGCNGASVCDPQPDGVTEAEFTIDDTIVPPKGEVEILELPCTIESVAGEAPALVTLTCPMGDAIAVHTIEMNVPTTLNLVPGTDVVFSHVVNMPFWIEEWFSLRLDFEDVDPLLLAGARGTAVDPVGIEPLPEPFYGNVTLTPDQDACELEPVCEPNACAQERREAIAVAVGGQESSVYDGRTELVGDTSQFQIRVGRARSLVDVQCDDVPERWYELVVVNVTEG